MSEGPADRLRTALEMFEVGHDMMRARLRREHPDWDDHQVDAAIRTWLRDRPGAPHGDFPGARSTRQLPRTT
ncbi:MAG: hypothetical protein ACOYBY_19235 [Dermatophilaceae bacterium]